MAKKEALQSTRLFRQQSARGKYRAGCCYCVAVSPWRCTVIASDVEAQDLIKTRHLNLRAVVLLHQHEDLVARCRVLPPEDLPSVVAIVTPVRGAFECTIKPIHIEFANTSVYREGSVALTSREGTDEGAPISVLEHILGQQTDLLILFWTGL